jgi:hypothetical protein
VRDINNLFIVGRPFARGDFYMHEDARLLIREEYLRLERTGSGSMNSTIPFFDVLDDGSSVISAKYIDNLIERVADIKRRM